MNDNKSKTQDFLAHIRAKTSTQSRLNRIEQRTASYNAKRINYDKVAKKIKAPNLEEFKTLCGYFSRDKKFKDLQRIRLSLLCGPRYAKVFMETEGALYALVGHLTGINTKAQIESLYSIINLGMGTEEQCLRVCKKASTYLVTCLGGNNSYLQDLCCWAFGNLCGTHPKVCALIKSQGFEEAVFSAFLSAEPSFMQWGCYALNHYFSTVPHTIKDFCKPEIVKQILLCLFLGKEYVGDIGWCLFIISTEPELCTTMVNFGAVSMCIKVMHQMVVDGTINLKASTALVRVLSNCVAVMPEVAVGICYQIDNFVAMITFLLQSQYPFLQNETIQLVANVMNGASVQPVTGRNVLEDSNFKKRLEPILRQTMSSHFKDSEPPNFQFVSQYS